MFSRFSFGSRNENNYFPFVCSQSCTSGQTDLRRRHIHYIRAPSVRAGGHHLEHVPEEKDRKLEQRGRGILTSHIRRTRHL